MTDKDVLGTIRDLVDEEHQLRSAAKPDPARLQHLEEQLDQCWDLLRQRRARTEFGESPDGAQVRPTGTVEGYTG